MFEKLWEVLKEGWDWIAPCFVCFPYEGGVVLRDGKWRRDLVPGWNWKIPFREYVVHCNTCEDTEKLDRQEVTTKDGVNVRLRALVRYQIVDPQAYLLKVQDQKQALEDVATGLTRRAVEERNFDELVTTKWEQDVTERLRRRVEKYGVRALEVTYSDLGKRQLYVALRNEPPQP